MKRYSMALGPSDIPFMKENPEGPYVLYDEAMTDQFRAGQAYEVGVLRRTLQYHPALITDEGWWRLLHWMTEERIRHPYP